MRDLEIIRSKHGFISDMDGVIYQGSQLLPGVCLLYTSPSPRD